MPTVDRDKVLVADAAYDFPLSHLPRGVSAVLRYVGSPTGTPHLVSLDAVAAIRAAGYAWAPIWTPDAAVFTRQLGLQAGNGMVDALRRYSLLGPEPVFLDIEKHVYDAAPESCMAGVSAWQNVMHQHGHQRAYAYLPAEAGQQWVADWVNVAPHHFAPGVIGVQYAGAVHGDEFDLSVFSRSLFQPLLDAQKGSAVALTDSDKKWLTDQLAAVQDNLARQARAYQWDNMASAPQPHANKHLDAKLDQVLARLSGAGAGPVDPAALADAIVARGGPQLAALVADLLSRRLAS